MGCRCHRPAPSRWVNITDDLGHTVMVPVPVRRVVSLAPGETDTPNLDVRPRPPAKADLAQMLRPEDISNAVIYVASQPERVSIALLVITPTVRRDYQADYERYVAEGHSQNPLDLFFARTPSADSQIRGKSLDARFSLEEHPSTVMV